MRRLAAVLLLAAAPLAVSADRAAALDPVYFGSSSASVTWEGFAVLRAVAAAMKADPAMRIEVEGHSDKSGSTAMNLQLSRQRAVVVREFLVSFGVEPERLVARGYGDTRSVNDNKTLELRAWNRRVQFRRLDAAP